MAKLCYFIHTANSNEVVGLRDITKTSTDMLSRMKAFSKSRKLTLVATDMSMRFVSRTKCTLKAFKTIVLASVSRIGDHKIADHDFFGSGIAIMIGSQIFMYDREHSLRIANHFAITLMITEITLIRNIFSAMTQQFILFYFFKQKLSQISRFRMQKMLQ